MTSATGSTFVYVTYIRTTPEKLWAALTSADMMQDYWLGVRCESDWKPGSPWRMVYADGCVTDSGEILEAIGGFSSRDMSVSMGPGSTAWTLTPRDTRRARSD